MDIRRILKNKSYQYIAFVVTAVVILLLLSFNSPKKIEGNSTIVFDCSSLVEAINKSKQFEKSEYRVLQIAPYTAKINGEKGSYSVSYHAFEEYTCVTHYILVMQK